MVILKILVYFIGTVFVRHVSSYGEKANAECKRYGLPLPECHNVLHPESRVRVKVDLLMYPHMVVLGYGEASAPTFKCGASLISAAWVLTAAHCIQDPVLGRVAVMRAGAAVFEFDLYDFLVQDRSVARVVAHPGYKPPSKYDDIALLKPDRPFELSQHVRIACLQTEPAFPDTTATVMGFGVTEAGGTQSSQMLLKVDVDIVDSGRCNKSMKAMIRQKKLSFGISDGQLCAGDWHKGGRDTCQGDSGGSMVRMPKNVDCKSVFPLHYIVGVTSFGKGCGYKKSPGVYTRVSKYVPWIEATVWP